MPNQRAQNKVFLGLFLDRELKLHVQTQARAQRLTTSQWVARLLADSLGLSPGSRAAPGPLRSGATPPPVVSESPFGQDDLWRL